MSRELKEIEECVKKVGSKSPISKGDKFVKVFNFFNAYRAIIIISIVILSLLLLFKPKIIKDDVTGKITFVNTVKWWIILTLGAYFSVMLNTKLSPS